MTELAKAAVVLAGILGAWFGWLAFAPASAAAALLRFPRHRAAGIVLAALALVWSAWMLYRMPMESLESFKPWLFVLAPAGIILVSLFMDDLLAPRALGGLLSLAPVPLLDAARFHPSPWSLLVKIIAYVMVIKGMALLLSPYLFRRMAAVLAASPGRTRLAGCGGLGVALLLAALAMTVY
jgi:hypothetical protein